MSTVAHVFHELLANIEMLKEGLQVDRRQQVSDV